MFFIKLALMTVLLMNIFTNVMAQTSASPQAFSAVDFCLSFVKNPENGEFFIPASDGRTVTSQCTNWLRQNHCEDVGGAWLEVCRNSLRDQLGDITDRYNTHLEGSAMGSSREIRGRTNFAGATDLAPINTLSSCQSFLRVHTSVSDADFSGFCSNPSPAFREFVCKQNQIRNCSSEENFQRALYGYLESERKKAELNPGTHTLDFLRQFPVEMAEVEAGIIAKMQADGKNICRLSLTTQRNQTYMAIEVMAATGFENGVNANPTVINTLPSAQDFRRRGDAALKQAIENSRSTSAPANQRCGYYLGGFYGNRQLGHGQAYCSYQYTDDQAQNYSVGAALTDYTRPTNITAMRFVTGNYSWEEIDNRIPAGGATWQNMRNMRRVFEESNYCRENNQDANFNKVCILAPIGNSLQVTAHYRLDEKEGRREQVFNEVLGTYETANDVSPARQGLSYICNPENTQRICPDGLKYTPEVFNRFEDLSSNIPSGVTPPNMNADQLRQLCQNYIRSQSPESRVPRRARPAADRR